MKRKLFYAFIIALVSFALVASSCNSTTGPAGGGSPTTNPTAAYIALFEAVKKKDTEGIKKHMSKETIGLAQFMSSTYKKPLEKVLENGMSETTMQPSLPQIQNEKISHNDKINAETATIDVKNPKGEWEQIPFVKEDGSWKLAFGEVMKGIINITQPGKTNPTLNQNIPAPTQGTNTNTPPNMKRGGPPLAQPIRKDEKKPK
jgi:hypothetical protein